MSTQPQLDFDRSEVVRMAIDPCEGRHRGNPESQAAHARILHTKAEAYRLILEFVGRRGAYGATVHEIALELGYGREIHKVSGRLSELKAMNRLKKSGKRGNAAVLVLAEGKQ